MTELDANVIGALIIVACVGYAVVILRAGDKDRFPW